MLAIVIEAIFLVFEVSSLAVGPNQSIQWVLRPLSLGIKQLEPEARQSISSSSMLKNM
jgi:hypothetical protein